MVPFQKRPNFANKMVPFEKRPKIPQQKWYYFKKWLKLVNKKSTIWGFSFSPLKPPEIKPPFDLGN